MSLMRHCEGHNVETLILRKPMSFDHTPKKRFKKGHIVFRQGQSADCAYIIDRGVVKILHEKRDLKTLAVLGEGEIFGEFAIIDGKQRTATAVVEEDCELTVIPKKHIEERIANSDPIVRFLILMLLTRLRNTLEDRYDPINIKDLAKEIGKDFSFLYPQKAIDEKVVVLEKIKMESELLDGLNKRQFSMFFQPIVDIETEEIAGFESLVRWFHPQQGMIRPDLFIGVAEETSLIIPLGEWIVHETARRLGEFMEHTHRSDFFVSVNISGKQVVSPNFINMLTSAVQQSGIIPKNLKLEITEGVILDKSQTEKTLDQCRNLGFQLALDDFGTGYSGLRYLKDFVVDTVKLDKSFVQQITNNSKAAIMVESIINLANGLHIPVIAEGIETIEHAQKLKSFNCQFGQGYLYSRPVPFEDALAMLIGKTTQKKAA